jgi:hypothetical protein
MLFGGFKIQIYTKFDPSYPITSNNPYPEPSTEIYGLRVVRLYYVGMSPA